MTDDKLRPPFEILEPCYISTKAGTYPYIPDTYYRAEDIHAWLDRARKVNPTQWIIDEDEAAE